MAALTERSAKSAACQKTHTENQSLSYFQQQADLLIVGHLIQPFDSLAFASKSLRIASESSALCFDPFGTEPSCIS